MFQDLPEIIFSLFSVTEVCKAMDRQMDRQTGRQKQEYWVGHCMWKMICQFIICYLTTIIPSIRLSKSTREDPWQREREKERDQLIRLWWLELKILNISNTQINLPLIWKLFRTRVIGLVYLDSLETWSVIEIPIDRPTDRPTWKWLSGRNVIEWTIESQLEWCFFSIQIMLILYVRLIVRLPLWR